MNAILKEDDPAAAQFFTDNPGLREEVITSALRQLLFQTQRLHLTVMLGTQTYIVSPSDMGLSVRVCVRDTCLKT